MPLPASAQIPACRMAVIMALLPPPAHRQYLVEYPFQQPELFGHYLGLALHFLLKTEVFILAGG